MRWFAPKYLVVQKPFYLILLGFLLYSLAVTVALAHADALDTVSFIPQWQPQAQFAGYYVAYEKGFYRERGLDVKILRGGPQRPPSEMLAQGRADFGTMQLAGAIVRRRPGPQAGGCLPVVATFGPHADRQEVQRHHRA